MKCDAINLGKMKKGRERERERNKTVNWVQSASPKK